MEERGDLRGYGSGKLPTSTNNPSNPPLSFQRAVKYVKSLPIYLYDNKKK
jgi:hypothetical protein